MRRQKQLCPGCHTPQKVYKDGTMKLHERPTDRKRWIAPRYDYMDPPSLRGPGGLNAVSTPGAWVTVWDWCDMGADGVRRS